MIVTFSGEVGVGIGLLCDFDLFGNHAVAGVTGHDGLLVTMSSFSPELRAFVWQRSNLVCHSLSCVTSMTNASAATTPQLTVQQHAHPLPTSSGVPSAATVSPPSQTSVKSLPPSGPMPKEGLKLAWDGFTLLSKKIEPCLSGTIAQVPFTVFNALAGIGTVCCINLFSWVLQSWLHPQAVVENKNDMKELMERVDECAKVVGDALNEAVSDVACDRIDIFVQYVVHHRLLDI